MQRQPSPRELLFQKKHDIFQNFLQHTTQAREAVSHIQNHVTKALIAKKNINYLDIGCGYGDKTLAIRDTLIQHYSVKTHALEPSAELLSVFESKNQENVQYVNSSFENYKSQERFDLITCIHVLYYLPDWQKVISKMLTLNSDDGLICISLRTDDPICAFKNHFFPKLPNHNFTKEPDCQALTDVLCDMELPYTKTIVTSKLNVNSILQRTEAGKQLITFLLRVNYDDIPAPLQDEIYRYIEMHHENGYLYHHDGFIWL